MFEQVRGRSWRAVLFGPIEEVADAAYLAGGLGWALVVVGVVQCAARIAEVAGRALPTGATSMSSAAWIAAVVLTAAPVALGLLIWKLRSRVAACLALAYVLANLAAMAFLAARGRFAGNLLLAIVFLWVALRAVQATIAWHRLIARDGASAAQGSPA